MTDLRKAAQQALDYWQQVAWGDAVMVDKMDALRAALAQEQAETMQGPVAWINAELDVLTSHPSCWGREDEAWTPLYTAPPQRKPLTDEEIDRLWRDPQQGYWDYRKFARAIERKVRGEE